MNRTTLATLAAAAMTVVGFSWGVLAMANGFEAPRITAESAALPLKTPPDRPKDALDNLISRVSSQYKNTPGIHGVGRGFGRPDRDAIVIFVDNGGSAESLPKEIEGYPVVVEVVQGGFNINW